MIASTVREWWASGRTVELMVAGTARRVFVRDDGQGPCMTFLHGYPASSYEWADLWPMLTDRRLIALDFLGFGASDKPTAHDYDYPLDDQADLVEAVWEHCGVTESSVVSYDYGAIITQILQSRQASITSIAYLNASLYPELYRPRLIQRLAPLPIIGPAVWRRFDERAFYRSWAAVFGPDHPLDPAVAREHWMALTHDDSDVAASRRVLSYIRQRSQRAEELTATLTMPTPTLFLWGLADPVSGSRVAHALQQRLEQPEIIEYQRVGHAPHLEIPAVVARAIADRAN